VIAVRKSDRPATAAVAALIRSRVCGSAVDDGCRLRWASTSFFGHLALQLAPLRADASTVQYEVSLEAALAYSGTESVTRDHVAMTGTIGLAPPSPGVGPDVTER